MGKRYTYETTLYFGDEAYETYVEMEITASYEVAWGSPESGRWGPPEDYDPGAGDLIEDVRVETIDGKSRPWSYPKTLESMILDALDTPAHEEAMINEASETEAAREDMYRERMWDDRP